MVFFMLVLLDNQVICNIGMSIKHKIPHHKWSLHPCMIHLCQYTSPLAMEEIVKDLT